jgi:chromosome partitioning protein
MTMTTDETGARIFSASNLEKIFQLDISKSSLLSYEERGIIPRADRTMRGRSAYRSWKTGALPHIGSNLGFLKRPKKTKVVSIFSLKGGTGKTTFAFQFARSLALHNIRTLMIGLDAQESVTQTLNRTAPPAPDDQGPPIGLFHVLSGDVAIESVVVKTDLDTLHYVPETIELSVLDRFLKGRMRKEYVLKEQVVDPLIECRQYDVIIFDCNPAWSDTVTGALAATDILISPLGCDINSLKAANIFVDLLADFQNGMKHTFERFLLVPSLAENNRLSQHILAKYRLEYDQVCTVSSIRRAVSVQEANVMGLSLMEVGFKTPVYQDFVGVFKEANAAMFNNAIRAESRAAAL